jgi:RNA polymerase sigma-70 factor (ECF subfamily)
MVTRRRKEDKRNAVLTAADREYRKRLNSYAFLKTHSRAKSEDLVQDTFVKTWAYLVKGGEIEKMKSFLYHVLNALIIDDYRKRKTLSLDFLLEKGYEPRESRAEDFPNMLDADQLALLALELPEKYQKVIRMRYMQNLSLQEISLLTGQSKNAVAVQVHRGLAKLKVLHDSKRPDRRG